MTQTEFNRRTRLAVIRVLKQAGVIQDEANLSPADQSLITRLSHGH